jgi:hypothetical protein
MTCCKSRAEPALQAVLLVERLLERMKVGFDPFAHRFHGSHRTPFGLHR